MFGVTALFPLLVSTSSLLIQEEPVLGGFAPLQPPPGTTPLASGTPTTLAPTSQGVLGLGSAFAPYLLQQLKVLWRAVSKKEILLPTIFVFLWQVSSYEGGTFGGLANMLLSMHAGICRLLERLSCCGRSDGDFGTEARWTAIKKPQYTF